METPNSYKLDTPIESLKAAAKAGYVGAQLDLALCYMNGQGVQDDVESAVHWLHRSAHEYHAEALFLLAQCYADSDGVMYDGSKALMLFKQAQEVLQYNLQQCQYQIYTLDASVYKPTFYEPEAQIAITPQTGTLNSTAQQNVYQYTRSESKTSIQTDKLATKYVEAHNEGLNARKSYNKLYQANSTQRSTVINLLLTPTRDFDWQYTNSEVKLFNEEGMRYDDSYFNTKLQNAHRNDSIAYLWIGNCYFFGHRVAESKVNAAEWYFRAALLGNFDGIKLLRECCNDILAAKMIAKRFYAEWENARSGNYVSYCLLAYCFKDGIGTLSSMYQSQLWFEMSAKQKYLPAYNGLASCQFGVSTAFDEYRTAANMFWQAAGLGCMSAMCNLGRCHAEAFGVDYNQNIAIDCFTKAANAENACAQYYLACAYATGTGVKRDIATAAEWMLYAASRGHLNALRDIRICDLSNASTFLTLEEQAFVLDALKCIYRTDETGNAAFNIGHCYKRGFGTYQDFHNAALYFKLAIKDGHVDASVSLGFLYENGLGVYRSVEEAFKHYRRAQVHSSSLGTANLALCYYHGFYADVKATTAAELLKTASLCAELFDASNNYAVCLATGFGTKASVEEAFALFQNAAKRGCACAAFNIAALYATGTGANIDHSKAVGYFKEAGKKGIQYALDVLKMPSNSVFELSKSASVCKQAK